MFVHRFHLQWVQTLVDSFCLQHQVLLLELETGALPHTRHMRNLHLEAVFKPLQRQTVLLLLLIFGIQDQSMEYFGVGARVRPKSYQRQVKLRVVINNSRRLKIHRQKMRVVHYPHNHIALVSPGLAGEQANWLPFVSELVAEHP